MGKIFFYLLEKGDFGLGKFRRWRIFLGFRERYFLDLFNYMVDFIWILLNVVWMFFGFLYFWKI